MRAIPGREGEVERLNHQLLELYRTCPGFLAGYYLKAADGSQEVGRLTIWESHQQADSAANLDYSLALRSQLHLLVQPGHVDRSFFAE